MYGLMVLILVYASLFSHRIPVPIQNALFLAVLLLEIVLMLAGWWYCIKNKKANGVPSWRKILASPLKRISQLRFRSKARRSSGVARMSSLLRMNTFPIGLPTQ